MILNENPVPPENAGTCQGSGPTMIARCHGCIAFARRGPDSIDISMAVGIDLKNIKFDPDLDPGPARVSGMTWNDSTATGTGETCRLKNGRFREMIRPSRACSPITGDRPFSFRRRDRPPHANRRNRHCAAIEPYRHRDDAHCIPRHKPAHWVEKTPSGGRLRPQAQLPAGLHHRPV